MKSLFTDGGVWKKNPSKAGTYAWCFVVDDVRQAWGSGVLFPSFYGQDTISNNVTELHALLTGIENLCGMDEVFKVTGKEKIQVFSDSNCTLGRFFRNESCRGVPDQLVHRMGVLQFRYEKFLEGHLLKGHLLKGHPTLSDLVFGEKDGRLVSKHNVFVDDLCTREANSLATYWEENNG